MASKKGYTVPELERDEYFRLVARANSRLQRTLAYIERESITDVEVKQTLAHDYHQRSKWAGAKTPLHKKVRFNSEADYRDYIELISRWGAFTGGEKGDYYASPTRIEQSYREAIERAISGMMRKKEISLEEWGGDLPPHLIEALNKLNITQLRHFFKHTSITSDGEMEEFDSDENVRTGSLEDAIDYIEGTIKSLNKYYPRVPVQTVQVRQGRR